MLVHTDGRVVLSDFGVTATLERHEDAAGVQGDLFLLRISVGGMSCRKVCHIPMFTF